MSNVDNGIRAPPKDEAIVCAASAEAVYPGTISMRKICVDSWAARQKAYVNAIALQKSNIDREMEALL